MRITLSTKQIYDEEQVGDILNYYDGIIDDIKKIREKRDIYIRRSRVIIDSAKKAKLHTIPLGEKRIKELEKMLDEIEIKNKNK